VLHETFNDPRSGIKREDVIILSKVSPSMMHPEGVKQCLRETLNDLQIEYLDILMVHSPVFYAPVQVNPLCKACFNVCSKPTLLEAAHQSPRGQSHQATAFKMYGVQWKSLWMQDW
jgi:diketogulonate reductase-like aldo/keto reductase